MKRIKILLLLFFLATVFSVNAMSLKSRQSDNNRQQHRESDNDKQHDSDNDHRGQCPPVGVPLDGGLLTVLGVAGVAYYTARKKGKKLES